MTPEYQNLADFLQQPGQTVADLQRKFNQKRVEAGMKHVSSLTFYQWCRGDYHPTKDWDIRTLSELTGIAPEKLYA